MNQPSEYEDLLSIRWIRELNGREQDRLERLLSADPKWKAQWQEDMAVLEAVLRLPDVPVASNFTSRVVAALPCAPDESGPALLLPTKRIWFRRLAWAPKWCLGFGFAALLALAVFYGEYKRAKSMQFVESLTVITESETAPTMEESKHFEFIQELAPVPLEVDWELILASDSMP